MSEENAAAEAPETTPAPAKKAPSLASLAKGNGTESIKFIPLSSIEVDEGYNVRQFDPTSSDKDMECHQKTLNRLALVEEEKLDPKKVIEHALHIEMKDPDGNKLGAPRLVQGHRRYGSISLVVDIGEHVDSIGEDPLVPVLEVVFESEAERQFDLIESNKHAELTMAQAGEVFQRLKDLEYSADEIAERSGYKVAHVYNCLKFYNMAPAIKRFVEKGVITPTMAIDITRNAKKIAKDNNVAEGLKGKQAVPTEKQIAKVEVEIVKEAVAAAQLRAEESGLKKFAKVIKADAASPKSTGKSSKSTKDEEETGPEKPIVTMDEWTKLNTKVAEAFDNDPEIVQHVIDAIAKVVEVED